VFDLDIGAGVDDIEVLKPNRTRGKTVKFSGWTGTRNILAIGRMFFVTPTRSTAEGEKPLTFPALGGGFIQSPPRIRLLFRSVNSFANAVAAKPAAERFEVRNSL
jgi:hypothetical protein